MAWPWLRRSPVRRAPLKKARTKPALELLEDRLAPAVFIVQTAGDAPGPVIDQGGGVFTAQTLRAAIDAANDEAQHAGPDTIVLQLNPAGPQTIVAALNDTGHPAAPFAFGPTAFIISSDITILGPSNQAVTIDGNGTHRLFGVMAGTTLTLQFLILTHGNATGGAGGNAGIGGAGGGGAGLGGAIFGNGTVNIGNCTLFENLAQGGAGGAGNGAANSLAGAGGGAVGGRGGDALFGGLGGFAGGGAGVGGAGGNGREGAGGAGGAQEDGVTQAASGVNGASGGGGGGGDATGNTSTGGNGLAVSSAGFGGGGGGTGFDPRFPGAGGAGGFGGGGGGGSWPAGGNNTGVGGAGGFGVGGGGANATLGPGGAGGFGAGGGARGNNTSGGGGGGGAGLGGAIFINTGGVLNLVNSTIANNVAAGGGGGAGGPGGSAGQGLGAGVFNRGTATIRHSTLAGNSADTGAALFNLANAPGQTAGVTLINSILANSVGGADVANQQLGGNALINARAPQVNLIESRINRISGNVQASGVLRGDPNLGPLVDNGGGMLTMLPGAGPAINSGNNTGAAGLEFEQRGPGFRRIINTQVDLGALEAPTLLLRIRIYVDATHDLRQVRCAVPRCVSSVGWKSPSGNWSFQPVASGAAWEVTNTSEPSLNQDR